MSTHDDLDKAKANSRPIEAIRNIIFGEQEKSFSKKFSKLEQTLSKLDNEFAGQLKTIQNQLDKLAQDIAQMQTSLEQSEANLNNKIDEVRSDMHKNTEKLEKSKINRISFAEKLENLVQILRDNK